MFCVCFTHLETSQIKKQESKMNTNHKLLAVLLLFVLTLFPSNVSFAQSITQDDKEEKKAALIKNFENAVQLEVATGETTEVQDPKYGTRKILINNSAKKMEALWAETAKEIAELEARSLVEREKVIKKIKEVDNSAQITYMDKRHTPYQINKEIEIYQADQYFYSVDISSEQIVEVVPVQESFTRKSGNKTKEELKRMAEEFVAKVEPNANISQLNGRVLNKGDNYFFRWEDTSQKLDSGMYPFLQVAYANNGDFLNYFNTLPFADGNPETESIAAGFNEIYANGSSTYFVMEGSYSTINNAGYCYIAGWCSPKNFFYTTTTTGSSTARGYWFPNPTPLVSVYAFVPGTYATTLMACYVTTYGSNLQTDRCINQNAYIDAWVSVTYSKVSNVAYVKLTNSNDGGGGYIAWDEMWIYE